MGRLCGVRRLSSRRRLRLWRWGWECLVAGSHAPQAFSIRPQPPPPPPCHPPARTLPAPQVLATYLTACARSVAVAEAGDTGRRSRDSSNLLKVGWGQGRDAMHAQQTQPGGQGRGVACTKGCVMCCWVLGAILMPPTRPPPHPTAPLARLSPFIPCAPSLLLCTPHTPCLRTSPCCHPSPKTDTHLLALMLPAASGGG